METSMAELSRVGHKQMMTEKRGIPIANLERVCEMDGDIVSSAWKHAAVCRKTAMSLRLIAKITDEEGTHLQLFLSMWHTLTQERPELFTEALIYDVLMLFDNAVNHEIIWGKYIIQEGVPGLSNKIMEDFIRYLADERLSEMGLSRQYNVQNPAPWFKDASSINGTNENGFETKVKAYQTSALEWD